MSRMNAAQTIAAGFALVAVALAGQPAAAQGHNFAYVGYLDRDGVAVNEVMDFQIDLFDGVATGTLHHQLATDIMVSRGRFSLVIGPVRPEVVSQQPLWVGLAVKRHGDVAWKALQGRQQLATTIAANGVPTGTIVAFGGNSVPVGWKLCDGSGLKSADYPALFAAIGTLWGNGTDRCASSPCQFNLPDLRGRFPRGYDASGTVDTGIRNASAAGGSTAGIGSAQAESYLGHIHGAGTYLANSSGEHSHGYIDPKNGSYRGLNWDNNGWTVEYPYESQTTVSGAHTHALSGYSGTAGGDETRPDNAAVHYIIKY